MFPPFYVAVSATEDGGFMTNIARKKTLIYSYFLD